MKVFNAYSDALRRLTSPAPLAVTDTLVYVEELIEYIDWLDKLYMPDGSGFDSGMQLDATKSSPTKLVFRTAYHHMNNGVYDRWTTHTVVVTPGFDGINCRVTGRNVNNTKEYIGAAVHAALHMDAMDFWQWRTGRAS